MFLDMPKKGKVYGCIRKIIFFLMPENVELHYPKSKKY